MSTDVLGEEHGDLQKPLVQTAEVTVMVEAKNRRATAPQPLAYSYLHIDSDLMAASYPSLWLFVSWQLA